MVVDNVTGGKARSWIGHNKRYVHPSSSSPHSQYFFHPLTGAIGNYLTLVLFLSLVPEVLPSDSALQFDRGGSSPALR